MKIVVLIKHVPDSASPIAYAADLTTDRAAADCRLSELDEYAVEQALRIVEEQGQGHVTYVTMGPETAVEALRKALSMGGDEGVHVLDGSLHGSDALATSAVLAAALSRLEFDLVLCGMASTDAGMSVIPAMIAERMRLPALTMAGRISVTEGRVAIDRESDDAELVVSANTPCLASVTDKTGEARYPSFKGIMAAKKKPVATWSLADLQVDASVVGSAGAATTVDSAVPRPPRATGVIVTADEEAGTKTVDYLVTQKLV